MCSGDLGMYRVMPWAYPPISGGSSGGFSPDDPGSGSGGNHTFIMGKNSRIDLVSSNVYTSTLNKLDFVLYLYYFELGNVNNVTSAHVYFQVEKLIVTDDGDITQIITTNPKESEQVLTVPFDSIVNSYSQAGFTLTCARSLTSGSSKIVYIKGRLIMKSQDTNGNVVRTDTFDYEHGVEP